MIAGQPSLAFLKLIEAAMRGGSLASIKCGLLTNSPFTPTVNNVLSDLTQPTFTGYAEVTLTIGTLRSNANKDQIDPFGLATFQPTANTLLPQTATGVFISYEASGPTEVLLMTTMLPAPYTFVDDTFALDVEPEVIFPNLQIYGGLCTTCP